MKKIITTLCTIILIASMSATAFAAPAITNSIIGEQAPTVPVASMTITGYDLIRETGDQDEIVMPMYRSYLEAPEIRYINAPKDHSVYVYKGLNTNVDKEESRESLMPFAHEGLQVLLVACEKGMSCIIYRDRQFRLHAGWVESRFLDFAFPGGKVSVGNAYSGAVAAGEIPAMSWSKQSFVGTNQKFAVLAEPIRDCVQLKLAYQVTDTDGERFEDMLGTRTVYINDGTGWTAVGQFEYNEQGAVLVTVNLKEAKNVNGIAVIASCNEPDHVICRLEIQDLYTAA